MTQQERDSLLISMDKRQALMLQTLTQVEAEVRKTNGRVRDIEEKRLPPLEHHKTRMIATIRTIIIFSSALGVVVGIIVTLIAK